MTQTASRYARVLWELDLPEDCIGDTLSVFQESPELKYALCDPEVHLDKKEAVVDRVFPEAMRNFVKVLCRYRAIGDLEEIIEAYRIYANEHSRVVNATLTYVNPPNEEQMAGIKQFLIKTYNAKDVDLTEKQDPDLIGGFVLTAGDQEYDWSIRGRMQALGRKLTGGDDR